MSRIVNVLKRFNVVMVLGALLVMALAWVFMPSLHRVHAGEPQAAVEQDHKPEDARQPLGTNTGLAFIAAAIATGVGSIGAGIAVSAVGTAAVGAIAEKPELMGKALIYVALAEGIAIYGLLISIIILAKV